MRKELSQKALDELSFLKDWNQTIVDFLIKKENTEFFKELYQGNHRRIRQEKFKWNENDI